MNGSMFSVEKPPTAQNYAIGCEGWASTQGGSFNQPEGYVEGTNVEGLVPESLYIQQLADRGAIVLSDDDDAILPFSSGLSISAYPNPFTTHATTLVELQKPGYLDVTVYDLLGREIKKLVSHTLPAGIHALDIDGVPGSGPLLIRARLKSPGTEVVRYYTLVKL